MYGKHKMHLKYKLAHSENLNQHVQFADVFLQSEDKFFGNIQIFKLGTNLNSDTDVVPSFKIFHFFLLPTVLCTHGYACIMVFMDASLSQKINKMTQKHILIRLTEVLVH
jgi:hypothetical protein